MTLALHSPRLAHSSAALMVGKQRKPNKQQPPRSCDQCGRPQSVYRHPHETRCASCQIKTPPSDWRRLREERMAA